jgi:signal transduction histidine kinase
MPKVLTLFGLQPAIKDVIEFVERHDIKVEFESFKLLDRYAKEIELVTYRVFQELTNNIIKHANATEVSVQLYQNGDSLILLVEDNGTGIPNKSKKGFGLYNIDSR